MSPVTKPGDGITVTSTSPEEVARKMALREEVRKRLGYDHKKEEADERPAFRDVAREVAWAFAYAPENQPLNEHHHRWKDFQILSEWLREEIVGQLALPEETSWETIYYLTGVLVEEVYPSEEKAFEAQYFGMMNRLEHPGAAEKFKELELVKFQIVGRL